MGRGGVGGCARSPWVGPRPVSLGHGCTARCRERGVFPCVAVYVLLQRRAPAFVIFRLPRVVFSRRCKGLFSFPGIFISRRYAVDVGGAGGDKWFEGALFLSVCRRRLFGVSVFVVVSGATRGEARGKASIFSSEEGLPAPLPGPRPGQARPGVFVSLVYGVDPCFSWIRVQLGSPPAWALPRFGLSPALGSGYSPTNVRTRVSTTYHRSALGNLNVPQIMFVRLVRSRAMMQQGNLQSAAMSTLRQRVGECVAGAGGGAVGRCLVGHALGALRRLAAQPGTKATARVFETPHPYQNQMVSDRVRFCLVLYNPPLESTAGTR